MFDGILQKSSVLEASALIAPLRTTVMPSAPSRIPKKKIAPSKLSTTSRSTQARSSTSLSLSPSPTKKRHNTLYDAVAGRITTEGLLQPPHHPSNHNNYDKAHDYYKSPQQFKPSKYRDTLSRSTQPITPDEALFQRQRAPTRIHEDDIYTAHRHLLWEPNGQSLFAIGLNDDGGSRKVRRGKVRQLPQSDLLKSMHVYVSDFYATLMPPSRCEPDMESRRNGEKIDDAIGRSNRRKTQSADYHSFDETALLAMGILVEEMATEVLGATGNLVFVEGAEVDQKALRKGDLGNETAGQSKKTVAERWIGSETLDGNYPSVIARNEAAVKSGQTRKGRKVRKLDP